MKTTMAFKKGQSGNPKGRPAGEPNKMTRDLRAMILGALDQAGGEQYLAQQAQESPAAFMALVGKCLPKDVNLAAKLSLADLIKEARATLAKRT